MLINRVFSMSSYLVKRLILKFFKVQTFINYMIIGDFFIQHVLLSFFLINENLSTGANIVLFKFFCFYVSYFNMLDYYSHSNVLNM